MKVAIIGTRGYPYVYSGYETFVRELAERLVLRNVHVTIYCHRSLFRHRPKEVNGISLVYMPAIESKILSQFSHSFLSMIHACLSDTDVILAVNSANGPFGLLSRIFRKRTAINVDGLEWLRPKWKGLGSKYFYFASWLSTKLYDKIVNDSDEMRKVYLELFRKDSTVIAYGANKRTSSRQDLIGLWNLKPLDYYLIVGRLIPDNNADILIEGFMKSESRKELVIVGDVPYQDSYADSLKALAEKDSRLIFTGYVNDHDTLAELYHHSFVYFHGHEFGGTNPTLLKAMAYGCSIFALDTVFNRETLQDGRFGIFLEKSAEAVAEKVNWAESVPTKMVEAKTRSSKGITDKYNWDVIAGQYRELFTELISR